MTVTSWTRRRAVWPALGLLSLLSASALSVSACGGEDEGSRNGASCSPAALPCDVREASCREAVFKFTACMRGQPDAKLPPNRIITREQFAEETRAQNAAQAAASKPEDKRVSAIVADSFRLLAFLPENVSVGDSDADASIEGVAAYYHHLDKAITLISDSVDVKPLPGESAADTKRRGQATALNTLSHEYVHALQDQREDLTKLTEAGSKTGVDGSMAVDALVEGEAVLVSDLVTQRTFRMEDDEAWVASAGRARYKSLLGTMLDSIAESATPFSEAQLVLPYPIGSAPLAEVFLDDGRAGVSDVYKSYPTTLIGWVEDARDLGTTIDCNVPNPPSDYEKLGVESFGGTGLIAFFTRLGLDGEEAFEAARAWRSDLFAVYGQPEGSTSTAAAVAWRIRLKDEASAKSLEQQVRGSKLALDVQQSGREVLLTGASDAAVRSAWKHDDCPRLKSGGAMEIPVQRLLPKPPVQYRHAHHRHDLHTR